MKKMTVGVICLCAFVAGLSSVAFAAAPLGAVEVETQFDSEPASWGRVRRIVTPVFPPELLATGVQGVVDVEVLINQRGNVKTIRELTSKPKNLAFEDATRKVLDYWEFANAMSKQCVPLETVGHARLHFEIENGEAKISLTHRALAKPTPPATTENNSSAVRAQVVATNRAEVLRSIRFPQEARRLGVEADAYGIFSVHRKTGRVTDVSVAVIPVAGDVKESIYGQFESEALKAMRRFKYEPITDAPDYAISRACIPMKFRLR